MTEGIIRDATAGDAKAIAPLLIAAMKDLVCKLIGRQIPEAALPLFEHFIASEDNQYSYKNIMVLEENGKIAGASVGYDGADLEILRRPVLSYIEENFGVYHEHLEKETESGEFYLDTVSVLRERQNIGLGRKLITATLEKARHAGYIQVGLLVEKDNVDAKRLYEKLGFEFLQEKTIAGSSYDHMVYPFAI